MNPIPNDNGTAESTEPETDNDRTRESFPPFDDPASSARPAGSPVTPTSPVSADPPNDTQYAGHPDFSQDAASNTPPSGIGNEERVDDVNEKTRHSDGQNPASSVTASPDPQKLGAGPAIGEHSKDAWEPSSSDDGPAEHSRTGEPGTTDQMPRWEGPPENRPRGYLPAVDDPETDRDAAGENLADPEKSDTGDPLKTRGD